MIDEIYQEIESDLKDNRPTFEGLFNEDQYVAQFLSIDDLNLESPEFEKAQDAQIIEEIPLEMDSLFIPLQEPQPKKKNEKKRSSFHNFQKHLVTTIRSIVDSSLLGQDSETRICELKLWKAFMNSSKINKTLVTLIFGEMTREDLGRISGYGLDDIVRDFNIAQIRQAQTNLCQEVVRQLREADMHKELNDRRMKNKQEFIVYFKAFLEELVKGQLDKRMAKCTKLLKRERM